MHVGDLPSNPGTYGGVRLIPDKRADEDPPSPEDRRGVRVSDKNRRRLSQGTTSLHPYRVYGGPI